MEQSTEITLPLAGATPARCSPRSSRRWPSRRTSSRLHFPARDLTLCLYPPSLVTVDVDENSEIAAKYQVRGLGIRADWPLTFAFAVDPRNADRDSVQGWQAGEPVQ
jgi:hypothetical protein